MMCKTLLMLVSDGPGNAGEVQCRAYTATDVITGVLNYREKVTQVWSFHLKHWFGQKVHSNFGKKACYLYESTHSK